MKNRIERFDMAKPPVPCRWYLRPLLWLLCFPALLMHRTKITKIGEHGSVILTSLGSSGELGQCDNGDLEILSQDLQRS